MSILNALTPIHAGTLNATKKCLVADSDRGTRQEEPERSKLLECADTPNEYIDWPKAGSSSCRQDAIANFHNKSGR